MESTCRPSHLVLISYRVGRAAALGGTPTTAGWGEGVKEEWRGEGTPFDIILGSSLIRLDLHPPLRCDCCDYSLYHQGAPWLSPHPVSAAAASSKTRGTGKIWNEFGGGGQRYTKGHKDTSRKGEAGANSWTVSA